MGQPMSAMPAEQSIFNEKAPSDVLPIRTKESSHGFSRSMGFAWGVSSMQGWRERMEDAHVAIPHMPHMQDMALFGVMDGHGGEQVARFCERHLPAEIARHSGSGDPSAALVRSFLEMDRMLAQPATRDELQRLTNGPRGPPNQVHPDFVGCTANMLCLRPDSYVVANAGDCRAVLCRNGRAVDLSEDHKPNLPKELSRIKKAGGFITEQRAGSQSIHRVNGDLSLSRAIGDLRFKQNPCLSPQDQLITSAPDVRTTERHPKDEFIIIACDGVWDVLTSQQVVDHVRPHMNEFLRGSLRPSAIPEGVLDRCLSPDLAQTCGLGGDNMTMMIIAFTGPPTTSPARL